MTQHDSDGPQGLVVEHVPTVLDSTRHPLARLTGTWVPATLPQVAQVLGVARQTLDEYRRHHTPARTSDPAPGPKHTPPGGALYCLDEWVAWHARHTERTRSRGYTPQARPSVDRQGHSPVRGRLLDDGADEPRERAPRLHWGAPTAADLALARRSAVETLLGHRLGETA